MEATTLFLLLLLPPADTAGDTAAGIQSSLRHEIGDVSIAVAPDTLVTPSMWQGEKAPMRARFVVRMVWKKKDAATVSLLAGAEGASKAYRGSRDLDFAPEDSKSERGRAIGLVIAELLRSSPVWAWAGVVKGNAAVQPARLAPSRLDFGAMFVVERPVTGLSAYGAALTYGFGLSEAVQLRAAVMALFGSDIPAGAPSGSSGDPYRDFGLTIGANWDFLRFDQNRYALGVGGFVGGFYESATFGSGGEHSASPSNATLAVGANLRGSATIWRSVRLVAEGGMRILSGKLEGTFGDDNKTTRAYSRWRPNFAAGLELAL
jgi:hypothetical protein